MRKLLLIVVLVLGAGAAQADSGMLYVGAGATYVDVRDISDPRDIGVTSTSLNGTGWKVWLGVRPISLFAVEADYFDLGSKDVQYNGMELDSIHLDYKAAAAYAVGYLPIPLPYLDVFGKIGVARYTQHNDLYAAGGGVSYLADDGTGFAWGVGGQVRYGNFGGRLEYERLNIRDTGGANVVALTIFLNVF